MQKSKARKKRWRTRRVEGIQVRNGQAFYEILNRKVRFIKKCRMIGSPLEWLVEYSPKLHDLLFTGPYSPAPIKYGKMRSWTEEPAGRYLGTAYWGNGAAIVLDERTELAQDRPDELLPLSYSDIMTLLEPGSELTEQMVIAWNPEVHLAPIVVVETDKGRRYFDARYLDAFHAMHPDTNPRWTIALGGFADRLMFTAEDGRRLGTVVGITLTAAAESVLTTQIERWEKR